MTKKDMEEDRVDIKKISNIKQIKREAVFVDFSS